MKARKILFPMLLVAAVPAFGFDYWGRMESEQLEARLDAERKEEVARLRAAAVLMASQPRPDDLDRAWPEKLPRPQSAWLAREKTFYGDILAAGRFDTLIVPFQVQSEALDRATRSLMTAQLAHAVAVLTAARVPDPYLVARALGDGERRIDPAGVRRLAEKLGVRRIVSGYVGHTRNAIRVTVHEQDNSSGAWPAQPATPYFKAMRFSDDDPPLEVYQKLLPEILTALGLDPAALPARRHAEGNAPSALPSSPLGLTAGAAGPVDEIYFNHLLGLLTPRHAERTRERFFEKAMLAVLSMSPQAPNYNVLKARSYLHLGLRIAGVKALGTPETSEARHVMAMLNGNLPDAAKPAAAKPAAATPRVQELVAQLETNEMRAAYGAVSQGKAAEQASALGLPGHLWPFFVARAFTEWTLWAQYDNAMLKRVLELELPAAGFGLEELAGGAFGDAGKIQSIAHFSVLDHARHLVSLESQSLCCRPLSLAPAKSDYLDLIAAIGIDNLARQAHFLTNVQQSPERALAFLAQMEGAFNDHPQFTVAKGEAEWAMAKNSDGAARQGLAESALKHGLNAWFWEQAQTRTAARAYRLVMQLDLRELGFLDNLYSQDYPYRPFYPAWQRGFLDRAIANSRSALRNSSFDAVPLHNLAATLGGEGRWAELEQVLGGVEGRFSGEPQIPVLFAKMSALKGDIGAAEAHYRKAIAIQPDQWLPYLNLGTMLFEAGTAEKAAEVLGAFPDFKARRADNAVGLSNRAYEAGSIFYWSGNFSLAAPFYRLAAELGTGSEGSMASAIRLALIDGDYKAAATGSLQRAQRYNSTYAFRDYLGMLHAMGYEKDAWNGFNVLIAQSDAPHVWETALVGHRRDAASESQIAAWSAQEPVRRAGRNFGYAAIHLLRAAVTDRTPSDSLASKIEQVERAVWKLENGQVVRATADERAYRILGTSAPSEGSYLPIGVFERSAKQRVKSDLVLFADAYRAMRGQDFASARGLLQEAASLYDMRNIEVGHLLPYYALAAAKSGEVAAVQALLQQFPPERRRFDYHLALAVLQALDGKTDAAVDTLKVALHRRPHTENRVLLTEYQYADICEWLHLVTAKPQFRALALDWARKNRVFQPWFAWSHAMVAKLAPDGPERRQATAMAYYLDRNSERLLSLPAAQVKSASREFAARNPFMVEKTPSKRDRI